MAPALRRSGRGRAIAASAFFALLASAGPMLWLGFPVPHVSDEQGYLLAADTFAHGRLANPSPRVPEAFEAVHAIVRPSYASKYPPAPALPLAVGKLLGHPGVGVCLAAALFAAACCWFLQGWLPPPWPLVGATLVTLRIAIGSYWGQSYWGGTVAAIGGLLLYGALPRLFRGRAGAARLAWMPLALGVFLLGQQPPARGSGGSAAGRRDSRRRAREAAAAVVAAGRGARAGARRRRRAHPRVRPRHDRRSAADAVSPARHDLRRRRAEPVLRAAGARALLVAGAEGAPRPRLRAPTHRRPTR